MTRWRVDEHAGRRVPSPPSVGVEQIDTDVGCGLTVEELDETIVLEPPFTVGLFEVEVAQPSGDPLRHPITVLPEA